MNILENISLYNSQQPSNPHSDSASLFSTQFQSPCVSKLDMNSPFTSGFSLNSQASIAPQIEQYLQHIQSQNLREQYRILLLNEIMKLDGSIPLSQPQTLNFSTSNNNNLYGQQPQVFPRNNQPNLLDLLNIQQKQSMQLNPSQILSQLNEYNSQLLQTQQLQQQQQQQQQQLSQQNQQQIQQLVGSSTFLPSLVNANNSQLCLQQQQQQQQQQLHQSQQQYNFLMNAIQEKKLPSIISESNSQTKIIVPSQFSETTIDTHQNQGKLLSQQQMNTPEGIELERRRQERLEKIEKYKNKRRNWRRKISYDCRKKVADQRLRIKGRFISKKDTEKIKEIIGSSHSEAFNDKKNLRLEFMDNKMRQQNIELNPATSNYEILSQIEELLKKNREIHNIQTMQSVIKRIQKKQLPLFCFVKRHQANMLLRQTKQSEESQDLPIVEL